MNTPKHLIFKNRKHKIMKKVAIIGILVAIVGVIFFTQCEKTEDIQPFVNTKEANALLGKTWYINKITKGKETFRPKGQVSVEFLKGNTILRLNANDQCKASSSFMEKDRINISERFLCENVEESPYELEKAVDPIKVIFKHFQGEIKYFMNKEQLVMESAAATFYLTKEPQATVVDDLPEPYPFEGTEWQVEKIFVKNEFIKLEDAPIIEFRENNTMYMSWSKNNCKKTYSNEIGNYLQLDTDDFTCENECCHNENYQLLANSLSGRQSYRMENGTMVFTNSKNIKVYLNATRK
jgi:hypothetical protein